MNAAVAAALAAALAAPVLSGAHVGLLAVDADTGAPIAAYNADDSFVPASTMKLLVGSAALARLDPSFAYVTSL
jgi:D-alanyl-D-alanine carboxypeptidase